MTYVASFDLLYTFSNATFLSANDNIINKNVCGTADCITTATVYKGTSLSLIWTAGKLPELYNRINNYENVYATYDGRNNKMHRVSVM